MADHLAIPEGTPTQVAHPWQTVLRTAVTYVIAGAAFLGAAIPIIQEVMGPYLPEGWAAWLTGLTGFMVAVGLLVTRLMALAKAQRLLQKLKLGTGVEKEATAQERDA